jgi:hypothetical protein
MSDDRRAPGGAVLGRFPHWIWAVYLLLFGLSVPWYWPADMPLRLWLGLPHLVTVSLAATHAIAAFTALVVQRYRPGEEQADR